MNVEILEADLTRPDHPMGNASPLPGDVMERLIPGLQTHPTTVILLAWSGGDVVGIATCFRGFSTFYARPVLNIHDLAVLPQFRGRGVGRQLIEAVARKARQLGCFKVTLEVHEENVRAKAMYEAAGFAEGMAREPGHRWLFYSKML